MANPVLMCTPINSRKKFSLSKKNVFFCTVAAVAISSTLMSQAVAETQKSTKQSISLSSQKSMAKQLKTVNQVGQAHVLVPDSVIRPEKLHPSANLSYKVKGTRYQPMNKVSNFSQEGKASWYGKQFHGRKTASGERYDMNEMTAAHRTLPIPSYAKVTNLANGKEVIVRINDRGPFHSSRVLDVSYGAAKKIGHGQYWYGKGTH